MVEKQRKVACRARKDVKRIDSEIFEDPPADRGALLRPGFRLGVGWIIEVRHGRFNRIYRRCAVCGDWYRIDLKQTPPGQPYAVSMYCGAPECKKLYLARSKFGAWFDPECIGPKRRVCSRCGRPHLDPGLYVAGSRS